MDYIIGVDIGATSTGKLSDIYATGGFYKKLKDEFVEISKLQ